MLPVPSPFIILLRFYCYTAVHADADVMVNFESGEKDDFAVSDRGSSPVAIAVLWLLWPVQWDLDKPKSERTGKIVHYMYNKLLLYWGSFSFASPLTLCFIEVPL